MSRQQSWINTSEKILEQYKGEEPLASFLKKFFASDKKYGSSDRKEISRLCYDFFRNAAVEKFNSIISADELSGGVDVKAFRNSFLEQPDLFIRIRPGYQDKVISKLVEADIESSLTSLNCIRLENTTKLDKLLEINKEIVIQDSSSQAVGELIKKINPSGERIRVWDCCAASGGKSILASDILGNIDLTVSDIRESILVNLRKRFRDAGIKKYRSFKADLTASLPASMKEQFKLIIADVPCTGSGTWSRTPEQLFYFNPGKINEYVSLQEKIISNIWPSLEPGGFLLYITCSVFKKENEEQVDKLKQKFHAGVISMELIKGYEEKADTLFAALMKKPL